MSTTALTKPPSTDPTGSSRIAASGRVIERDSQLACRDDFVRRIGVGDLLPAVRRPREERA